MIVATHLLPVDVFAMVMNPILLDVCPNSQMILMKLPVTTGDVSASKYMGAIRQLAMNLPPILLMNSSTHLPVITRYI